MHCNYDTRLCRCTFNNTGLPEVVVTPFNQSVEITLTAKFIATVKGVGPFTYQWQIIIGVIVILLL